jgi:CheY-like chemotaxis protein
MKARMDPFQELRKLKMLLVDDDEWIRDSLSMFFKSEGCSFVAFETAEEGLAALSEQGYDVIIADYRLPGMNGLEFLKMVTRKTMGREPIKILITAYGNDQVRREMVDLGVHGYIAKPFSTKTLVSSLGKLVENRNPERHRNADRG